MQSKHREYKLTWLLFSPNILRCSALLLNRGYFAFSISISISNSMLWWFDDLDEPSELKVDVSHIFLHSFPFLSFFLSQFQLFTIHLCLFLFFFCFFLFFVLVLFFFSFFETRLFGHMNSHIFQTFNSFMRMRIPNVIIYKTSY